MNVIEKSEIRKSITFEFGKVKGTMFYIDDKPINVSFKIEGGIGFSASLLDTSLYDLKAVIDGMLVKMEYD